MPAPGCVGRHLAAGVELVGRQRAEAAEQVVDLVGVAGPAAVDQALQLELEVGEHVGVEQLAQLLGAEQLASRSRSSARAAARRSASGASPSYM